MSAEKHLTAEDIAGRLLPFVVAKTGTTHVSISGVRRMPGGASRETWALDVEYEHDGSVQRLPLVLRRDPGAASTQTSRRQEFHVLAAARAAGVPVPRVYWLGDETETLAARFFLMERVEGETLGRRLLRDRVYARARQVMTGQLGEILARIHVIDPGAPGLKDLARPAEGANPALEEVDRYEQIFRFIAPDPHPALELTLRWLRASLPEPWPLRLVHGDYRIGNILFGPEGTRSVLDWELAHLGDPMEDLGWLCVRAWRFGQDAKSVGGLGEREELFAAYERAGGVAPDPRRVRFWEVFGNLKWAVICMMQAKTHLDGMTRSVELVSLGRRTAEVELELLDLIDGSSSAGS